MQRDILLVEDNPDDIELTMDVFNTLGIAQRVKVVESGEAALAVLFNQQDVNTNNWKVILLDLNLPGINGTEVLEQVRHNSLTDTIPVVML